MAKNVVTITAEQAAKIEEGKAAALKAERAKIEKMRVAELEAKAKADIAKAEQDKKSLAEKEAEEKAAAKKLVEDAKAIPELHDLVEKVIAILDDVAPAGQKPLHQRLVYMRDYIRMAADQLTKIVKD